MRKTILLRILIITCSFVFTSCANDGRSILPVKSKGTNKVAPVEPIEIKQEKTWKIGDAVLFEISDAGPDEASCRMEYCVNTATVYFWVVKAGINKDVLLDSSVVNAESNLIMVCSCLC